MRTTSLRIGVAALLALFPLAACGHEEDAKVSTPPAGDEAPSAADEIPAQEDLDAEAAKDITDENADAAYDDLKGEIEGDK